MARIRDYATTIYAAATTANMVMDMPVHETGDLLLGFVGKDGNSAFTTPSGWTLIRSATSAGAGGGVYAKRATSSSEAVTFPLSADTCVGTVIAVRDVYGTTVADAIPQSIAYGAEDSTLPFTGVGLTTLHANSLLFSHRFQDTTIGASHLPPWVNIFVGDAANGGSSMAYAVAPAASTVVADPEMWAGGQDDGKMCMIEVRDGSSGTSMPPYIPLSVVPAVLVSPLVGTTGVIDRGSYAAASAGTILTVAGKTTASLAVANTADSGYNPFRGSLRNAGTSSTVNLNNVELNLTATQDVTAGNLLFGTYLHLTPRDYLDKGTVARGGQYFLAGSDSTNWRAWVVGGQFSKTDSPNSRVNWLVQPSFSTSQYDSAGTPNFAALDLMQFGSSGYFGAPSILWNELWELREAVVAGGSPSIPFRFDELIYAVNSGCGNIPLLNQSGSAVSVWVPLKIGGVDPIGISINLRTFQWPRQADPATGYVDCHVADDKLGIEFHGLGSGDLIHFTNSVFTRDTPYYWRFNASHNAATSINFAGTTVIGANVTLRSTVSLESMAFIGCASFTQNAATLTKCTFTDTKVSSATLDDMALITDSTFNSSGTGHAIEVSGAADTVSLSGVSFNGYAGSNGSTGNEAIYVNIASGTVTINISGGDTPSIRTAGATVVVQNAVTVKVTVKDVNTGAAIENARVLIEKVSDGTDILTGATNSSGILSTSWAYPGDTAVIGKVRRATVGLGSLYKTSPISATITASGLDLTVLLIPD